MNRHLVSALIASLAFVLTSCPGPWADRNGKFQATPVNLETINSEFDDYNSNLAQNKYGQGYLIFSSKRERKNVFNLVMNPVELQYDDRKDRLSMNSKWVLRHNSHDVTEYIYQRLIERANQNCNVLGPITYPMPSSMANANGTPQNRALLLYADDSAGNLQIKFVHNFNDENKIEGPFEVSWLNGPKDDAYPSFTADFSQLYFCSNRDGNFDIFEVKLPIQSAQMLETLLSKKPQSVTKNERLSTAYDDKCPYVLGEGQNQTLYFTSDRPGGQGGFDIYQSSLDRAKWREPANLGNHVNTAYDEYRPIVPREITQNFNYALGIFSSNRPGGKGGFDLYMAGF